MFSAKYPRGVTLIETLIYMGLLTIFLLSYSGLLIQLATIQSREGVKGRLIDNGASALHLLQIELPSSPEIDVTNSVFGTPTSTLEFRNSVNNLATFDTVLTTVTFGGVVHQIRRLRYQSDNVTDYFTDADTNVLTWQLDEVRTSSGDLSGLNVVLELEVLNSGTGYRQGTLHYETTVYLTPYTIEI